MNTRLPTNWGGIAQDLLTMGSRPYTPLLPNNGWTNQAVPATAPQGPPVPMRTLPPASPATYPWPPRMYAGANAAAAALDHQADQLAGNLNTLLAMPAPASVAQTAANALGTLYLVRGAYGAQLAAAGLAGGQHFALYCAPQWHGAMATLQGIADDLKTQALAASPAGAGGPMRGLGIFSLNPNEWGMSQDEADAYEIQQGEHAVQLAALQKQATDKNPNFLDSLQSGAQSMIQAGASASQSAADAASMAMYVGVGLLILAGYVVYKESGTESGRTRLGHQAGRAAHAAGEGVKGAAHVAGAAGKAAFFA